MTSVTAWRQRFAVLGAVALIAAATLVVPGTFATGQVGTGDGPFGTAGILRLHLGAQDYFRFDPSGGGDPTQTNIVPGSGCKVSLANSSLVTATVGGGNGAALGLVSDGLGVRQLQEGNGTPCGQVNGTAQSMTIALAGVLGNKVADRAELDIEGKYNAKVKAEMFMDGSPVATQMFGTGAASDSGPDSGDGDNYRIEIENVLFDAIRLSVDPSTPTGAFSLEGGADGTASGAVGSTLASDTKDSLFRISGAEGVLNCGETVTETGAPGEPDATVQRLNNAECRKVLYSLDSTSDTDSEDIHFVKDLSDQPNASFFVTIDWDNEVAQYPLPGVLVDEGTGPYTADWCDGTFASPAVPAGGTAHWCVRKETAESAGTNSVHRTTYLFGFGDPLFTLPKLNLGG